MHKTDNIYIDALRFGVKNMQTGITFNELQNHLKEIGYPFDDGFTEYFQFWFFTNFFNKSAYAHLKYGNQANFSNFLTDIGTYLNTKCLMTAEAYEFYLDFEKLQQTRADSKKAQHLATIAIWISGGLALIQIVLQLISMFK